MNRPFHEMSDQEKRQIADELTMQPSSFSALFIAAVLMLVVLLLSPIPEMIASAGSATVARGTVAYIESTGK